MITLVYLVNLSLAIYSAAFGIPSSDILKLRNTDATSLEHYWSIPEPPPGPLIFNGTKLVHDEDHPWMPPGEDDIRGPCPGLNTLASHGYLPRSGIATPAQIVRASQEAFNLDHTLAVFATYAAFLVDGNLLTNLISIGRKSNRTGSQPTYPTVAGGIDTHLLFEGDASMTRSDFFFGDNHSFNQSLFNELVHYSDIFGAGKYNLTVAAKLKWKRIQDSIETNPTFSFHYPRYFTAYVEAVFPINLFIDGRRNDGQLDLDVALGFFRDMRMPPDFHRARRPIGREGMADIAEQYPISPGSNVERVRNYIADGTPGSFSSLCPVYEAFVNSVRELYPNPEGILRRALVINLEYLYGSIWGQCPQQHPYD